MQEVTPRTREHVLQASIESYWRVVNGIVDDAELASVNPAWEEEVLRQLAAGIAQLLCAFH